MAKYWGVYVIYKAFIHFKVGNHFKVRYVRISIPVNILLLTVYVNILLYQLVTLALTWTHIHKYTKHVFFFFSPNHLRLGFFRNFLLGNTAETVQLSYSVNLTLITLK